MSMSCLPDFGYEEDNFILDRGPDAPKSWRLLTDFVWNKEKYQWLQNHLILRKLRAKKEAEDETKKFSYHKNKSNTEGGKKEQQ